MDPYSPATTVVLFIIFGLLLSTCLVLCCLALEYDSFEEAFEDNEKYYNDDYGRAQGSINSYGSLVNSSIDSGRRFGGVNAVVPDAAKYGGGGAVGAQLEEALLK